MAVIHDIRKLPIYQKLAEHLRNPLYLNGYYLTLSSLVTSGIGLIYWILAAHLYSAHDIGINSAVIAIMTFLAGASELNLMSTLIRFIPTAGHSTRRMVITIYMLSLVISALVGTIFILMVNTWSPVLKFLGTNHKLGIWFVISTMGWCIFVLQDSVLTGLRQTVWVPIENAFYSVVKIILMLAFSTSFTVLGIFASWSFGLFFSIIPINYLIFRKLISIHEKKDTNDGEHVTPRQLVRFAAPDYIGALLWLMATTLMPVIVATVAGANANANFYLAWTIANTLYLICTSMGSSLVVEASRDLQKLGSYSYKTFKSTMKIIAPLVLLITLFAPVILMIYGKGYSTAGATLLRLLALSAIPNVFNTLYVSIARVQRRTEAVVAVLGTLCVMLIALSFIFLKRFGIEGVGYAWLMSQSIIATAIYFAKLRTLWRKSVMPSSITSTSVPDLSRQSALINSFYRRARKITIFPYLERIHQRWSDQISRKKVVDILPEVLNSLPGNIYDPVHQQWTIHSIARNGTSTSVAYLGPQGGPTTAILKLAVNYKEAESLRRQYKNLAYLYHLSDLGDWRELLPVFVRNGKIRSQEYFVETALPGIPLQSMLTDKLTSHKALKLGAIEINTLHQKTARIAEISPALFKQWTQDAFDNLHSLLSDGEISPKFKYAITKLHAKLYTDLLGKKVELSWIHGDYFPANILVSPDGDRITGIVDWDLARPNELPMLDVLHFIISVRMTLERREMGQVVTSLLKEPDLRSDEFQLLQIAEGKFMSLPISLHTLIILTWLRHINASLNKTSRFTHHSYWIAENIASVLSVL